MYNNNPETGDKSEYYRINGNQCSGHIYCNMTETAATTFIPTCMCWCGWRRIAHINISTGDDCPSEWCKTYSNVSFCHVLCGICSSTNFHTNRVSYQRVCGRARGYQKGQTFAFYTYHYDSQTTVDDHYADGLLITCGNHVWTFVVGMHI